MLQLSTLTIRLERTTEKYLFGGNVYIQPLIFTIMLRPCLVTRVDYSYKFSYGLYRYGTKKVGHEA
jgi:hypothetical protein